MSRNPLVSILIPTYNHEAFIGQCLDSVLAQDFPHWEAIVIDDASSDGTWEILETYAAKDPRIRIHRQARRGLERLVETYNFGLTQASGELVAILEGDDTWPKHKLAAQMALHTADIDMSCGRTCIIDAYGEAINNFSPQTPPGTYTFGEFFREYILRRTALIPVSVMLSRRALDSLGGFTQSPEYPAVDYSTFSQLLSTPPLHRKVAFSHEILGHWRSHASNTTKLKEATIVRGVYQLAVKRSLALTPEARTQLGLNKKAIFSAHEPYLSGVYLNLMRQALQARDREQVNEFATRLWQLRVPKRRLQAVFGTIFGRLGWDMEGIFRMYERATTNPMADLATDPVRN